MWGQRIWLMLLIYYQPEIWSRICSSNSPSESFALNNVQMRNNEGKHTGLWALLSTWFPLTNPLSLQRVDHLSTRTFKWLLLHIKTLTCQWQFWKRVKPNKKAGNFRTSLQAEKDGPWNEKVSNLPHSHATKPDQNSLLLCTCTCTCSVFDRACETSLWR